MSVPALVLVLLSGALNALWHLCAKRGKTPMTFLWWIQCIAVLVFLPFGLPALVAAPMTSMTAAYACGVALIHGISVFCLAKAYMNEDFSMVYPLMRGFAPLLIALWGVAVLREPVGLASIGGIACIVVGVTTMSSAVVRGFDPLAFRYCLTASGRWVPATAAAIAGYSIFDRYAMGYFSPVTVNWLGNVGNFCALLPFVWRSVPHEWRANAGTILLAGIVAPGSYLLFLLAMQTGGLAKMGAAREIGIVFSVILSIVVLRERVSVRRVIGATIITVGVMIVLVAR